MFPLEEETHSLKVVSSSSTCRNRTGNAHGVGNTAEFANPQRQINRVEALFPELQNQVGLRCLLF